jgi:hypothetical protein
MPTFQSIPLHPVLRQRLLGGRRRTTATTTTTTTTSVGRNDDDADAEETTTATTTATPTTTGITTPHALLTRDPQELLQLLHGSSTKNNRSNKQGMAHIVQLRCQVAMSLLQATATYQAHHHNKKRKRGMMMMMQQHQPEEYGAAASQDSALSSSSSSSTAVGHQSSGSKTKHNTFLSGIIPGVSRSAWEQVQDEEIHHPSSVVATGCQALDELLSVPLCCNIHDTAATASSTSTSSHHHPHPHHPATSTSTLQKSNKPNKFYKIPLGTLLQISGPAAGVGKSQLALQMAAQVALAGHRAILVVSCPTSSARRLQPWLPADLLSNIYFGGASSNTSTTTTNTKNKKRRRTHPPPSLPVTLGRIEHDVFLGAGGGVSNVQLIVIDTLITDDKEYEYVMQWSRKMTRRYPIVIVLVTPTTTTPSNSMHADIHLSLAHTNNSTSAISQLLSYHGQDPQYQHNVLVTATLQHHLEKVVVTTTAGNNNNNHNHHYLYSIPLQVTALGLATPAFSYATATGGNNNNKHGDDDDDDEPLFD